MKAAVFYAPRDIRVETVDKPEAGVGEIVIKVKACGICGSDLHVYKTGVFSSFGTPRVMGHEFSGEVVALGAGVEEIKMCDRVTAAGYRPCGECYGCRRGQPGRCTSKLVVGYQLDGGLAEYVLVPNAKLGKSVFMIPSSLSWQEAATIEPVSVAAFVAKLIESKPGQTMVVLGAGMIGQVVLQALKSVHAPRIIVSEVAPKRLAIARKHGADIVVNPKETDLVKLVAEATSGDMADVVVEVTGSPLVFDQAVEILHPGGTLIQVGMFDTKVEINLNRIIEKNITLKGCLGGSMRRAIELMESGKVKTQDLITHRFKLDDIKAAFEAQMNPEDSVKVVVEP